MQVHQVGCSVLPSERRIMGPAAALLRDTARWLWPSRLTACLLATCAVVPLASPSSGLADAPPLDWNDFRGAWVGDAGHCRWPDDFLLIYDRRSAYSPHRSAEEPYRRCRILSVRGKHPEWKLRMSCENADPQYHRPRYEVRQTLRIFGDGPRMIIETEPGPGVPARTEEAFYCRKADAGPPPLICFSAEMGRTVPCED